MADNNNFIQINGVKRKVGNILKKIFEYKFGIILMLLFMVSLVYNVRAKEPTVVTTLSELTTAVTSGEDVVLGADISLSSAL